MNIKGDFVGTHRSAQAEGHPSPCPPSSVTISQVLTVAMASQTQGMPNEMLRSCLLSQKFDQGVLWYEHLLTCSI